MRRIRRCNESHVGPRWCNRSHRMRIWLGSAAFAGFVAFVIACGTLDDPEGDPSSGSSGSPGDASSSSSGEARPDGKAASVPRDFPLVTPSVGGYKLADVWSGGTVIYVPASLVWPKT